MKTSSLLRTSLADLLELVKDRWPAYIWYTFGQLLVVGGLMLMVFLFTLFFGSVFGLFMAPETMELTTFWLLGGVMAFVFLVVVILVQNYFTFGLYRLADSKSKDMSLHAFHEHAKKDYWKTLWALIVFGFVLAVVVAVLGLALVALAQVLPPLALAIIVVLLGLLAMYYALPFAFVTLQIVLKGDSALKAFAEARELISGRWWRTFGTGIVVGVVSGVPLFVLSFIAEMLDPSRPQSLTDFDPSSLDPFVATGELGMISLVFLVLIVIANILPTYGYLAMYRSLNKVK